MKPAISYTLAFVALAVVSVALAEMEYSPDVTVQQGKLRGALVRVKNANDDVYGFYGIPYAAPPVDTLFSKMRYAKPAAPAKFGAGTKTFVTIPNQCPQQDVSSLVAYFYQPVNNSEDCLTLNIYVPKKQLDAVKDGQNPKGLPIFFWIHGGGYYSGSSTLTLYNGTTIAAHQNIIFVAIQYRLGPLGFVYLGTNDAPGNQGLWDQNAALKWVYENIANFGGDPKRITVGGESAGAAAVTSQLLSPHSRPYIHQAIVESGAAIGTWASMTKSEALNRANFLMKRLGTIIKPLLRCKDSSLLLIRNCLKKANELEEACINATLPGATVAEKLTCLRGVTPDDLNKIQLLTFEMDWVALSPSIMTIPWVPVVDGDFIPYKPIDMMKNGDFAKVPLLIGANKNEGSLLFPASLKGYVIFPSISNPNKTFESLTHDIYEELVESYFTYYPVNGNPAPDLIKDAIKNQYWRAVDEYAQPGMVGDIIAEQIDQMIGDADITCPTLSWADFYANVTTVYNYMFSHRASGSPYPEVFGTAHADELPFVLGDAINENEPLTTLSYGQVDRTLSKRLTQYWANFITYGDPNHVNPALDHQLPLPQWPVYKQYFGDSLHIFNEADEQHLISALKARDCQFWTFQLPEMYRRLMEAPPLPDTTVQPCVIQRTKSSSMEIQGAVLFVALMALIAALF